MQEHEDLLELEAFGLNFETGSRPVSKSVEEFPENAILIIHQDPRQVEGAKEYRFELNKMAVDIMDLEPGKDYVVFSRRDDEVYLVKATGNAQAEAAGKRLYKSATWSNKNDHVGLSENIAWINTTDDRQLCELHRIETKSGLIVARLQPFIQVQNP